MQGLDVFKFLPGMGIDEEEHWRVRFGPRIEDDGDKLW